MHHGSVRIRRATAQDSRAIADVLTLSFHSGGWLETGLQPLWHFVLHDDLRQRLVSSSLPYACWLAIDDLGLDAEGDPNPNRAAATRSRAIATVELSVRPSDTWSRDPWLWPLNRLNLLRDRPHYPYIANLAVIASARRQGIARRLLERCERTARAWGYDRLYLHVLQDNTPARLLYQQQGYRINSPPRSTGLPVSFPASLLGFGSSRQLLLCKMLKP